MLQFEKVPVTMMEELQLGAGIVVDSFVPSTGVIGNILGATSGGIDFNCNPTLEDFGDGIDNLPPNTWQLQRIKYFDPHLTGTFKTMTAANAVIMQPGSALATGDSTHVVPGDTLTEAMFDDIWLIADYSDKNKGAATAGYVAIHIMHALNVLGFRLKTNDEGKGDFAFDFRGHYDLENIDEVPFEVYIKKGTTPTP